MRRRWLVTGVVGLAVGFAACWAFAAAADKSLTPDKLPAAVTKAFKAVFPNGQIEKLDAEEENGVMVYDIEFRDGQTEKETDITADGTMLEFTIVIEPKDLPPVPKKAIEKAAEDGKLGRTEHIELSYETKDGKVVKLPKTVSHYAAEITKGDQHSEVIVDADGKVLEAPTWNAAPAPKPEPRKKKAGKGKQKAAVVEPKTRPWEQVPPAVQATVLANGGKPGPVDKERKMMDGKAVYEAPAHDKNGKMVDLVVLEDGKLVEIKTDAEADYLKDQAAKKK